VGVICSGNIVFDILVRPVDHLQWGTTMWVDAISQSLGGNGANTSYALARLGVPVRLLGMTGADPFGAQLLATLEGVGVNTRWIARSGKPTATTVALVNSAGERVFLHRPGVSVDVLAEPVCFTAELAAGFSHYHLANVYGLPGVRLNAAESLAAARRAGLTTSLDTGWDASGGWLDILGPCLPHTGIMFVNQDEARMLTGEADPAAAAARLRQLGARDVVMKFGENGCAVYTGADCLRVPAFAVEAVDTTGAGDCFAGGFLAALHYGADLADAARFASAVGALSVGRLGAVAGLLSYQETRHWMKTAPLRP